MNQIRNSLIISSLIAVFIIGCNSGSSSSSTTPPSPTNTPTPTPTITPTPVVSPTPSPSFCQTNIANFSSLSDINLSSDPFNYTWGPSLANLPFPSNLMQCQSSSSWNQGRVLSAISYWVSQKVNYCHHHVPTWDPSYELNGTTPNPAAKASYESCSTNSDIMPPIPTNSLIRWNYSGIGNESAGAWYESGVLAYATGNYGRGLDCSDYTKLIYAYAESIYFTSDVSMQAGQSANENNLAPNMAGFTDSAESDTLGLYSAGNLVCNDGTLAPNRGIANNTGCNGHGGYISVFESNGTYNANGVTDAVLNNLQPGDLIYIAGCASDPYSSSSQNCGHNPRQQVTHVIIWTGQQIGSSSYITESMIAPETDTDVYGTAHNQCDSQFWTASNNIGNWIISDSHYQGPDYRAFTSCFYRNQVWGVRRVTFN